jgi:hypothetical protein
MPRVGSYARPAEDRVRKRPADAGPNPFLKSADLLPLPEAVTAAVESRYLQFRELRDEKLAGFGAERNKAR